MVQPFEHAGEQRGAALRDDACASPERVTSGARGRHWSGDGTSERDTRSQPRDSSTAPITSTVDGAPRDTEDRGSVSSWRDDLAARIDALKARQAAADAEWTPRIDEATRICLAHRRRPMRRYRRSRPCGSRSPAGCKARSRSPTAHRSPASATSCAASCTPPPAPGCDRCRARRPRPPPSCCAAPDAAAGRLDLAKLVRAFRRDAKRAARAARADSTRRLNAAHRRAERDQAAILAAWPDYIRRDDRDRLVVDAGERFIQLTRLPDRTELARTDLRRWLRDVTAWQWGAPADAVEFTDPDGRYAFVPLDAARLTQDGDRTRGPWISTVPVRKIAAERPPPR
jgi:PAS domain-containing protein